LFLSVRDTKKNKTDSSLNQEAPKKEAGTIFHKSMPARYYNSVPDLRNSSLTCFGIELCKPNSKEAKSALAVNIFDSKVVSKGLALGGSGPFSTADLLWPFEWPSLGLSFPHL
jgi:hypothetical protein